MGSARVLGVLIAVQLVHGGVLLSVHTQHHQALIHVGTVWMEAGAAVSVVTLHTRATRLLAGRAREVLAISVQHGGIEGHAVLPISQLSCPTDTHGVKELFPPGLTQHATTLEAQDTPRLGNLFALACAQPSHRKAPKGTWARL